MKYPAARLAVIGFLVAGTVAPLASSSDELIVTGIREQLLASIGPGFEHVNKIQRPTRRISVAQLGTRALANPDAVILAVGTLSNQQIRAMLELVGDGVDNTTKITGDDEFAVVQVGEPEHDPCCTTLVLFENRSGIWTMLGAIQSSH